MSRRKIARRVQDYPKVERFSPSIKGKREVREVLLEELEAMRLKDLKEMNQQEAADMMGISRQTFQNIIESGRKKVTDALYNGYAINIIGGDHILFRCDMTCQNCHETYKPETLGEKKNCPKCGSELVSCCDSVEKCRKWCL